MASNAASALLPLLAAGLLIAAALGLGLWIWYAAALSKLFPRLGVDGWKGWAPVLNEAEILSLGGKPAWGVVFFFIPVVQLYGLYLKVVATHRINKRFRHGGGFTLLAIVLPPVWATLLAGGKDPVEVRSAASGSGSAAAGARTRVASPRAALARDASGYAIPTAAAAGSALIDVVPGGSATASGESIVGSEAGSYPSPSPIAPIATLAVAAPASPSGPPEERWALVLDDGSRLPLVSAQTVLGRNPVAPAGAQALRIPDATRTLSKTHARLERDGSGWTLTDLNSTNGVQAFARDGSIAALAPGVPTPVHGRILLGDVGMLIVLDGAG